MIRTLILLSIAALMTACGTLDKISDSFGDEDNATPPTPLNEFSPRLSVVELWSDDVGDGSNKKYLKLSPIVESGRLYVAENGGDLLAFDALTGKQIWDIDTDQVITGGPGLSDLAVLVGTEEGELLAYDRDSAEALWRAQLSSEILSKPVAADGVVVARSIDGKLYGLSETTGKRLWVYNRKVPSLTLRGTGNPVIDSGLVLTGFDSGRLAAVDLQTGKLIWESRIAQSRGANELERMVDIDSEPIIDAGTIFVSTYQGNVAAIDEDTGQIQWIREISSFAGLAVNDEFVFVSDEQSNLWALDRYSGDSVWKQDSLLARSLTAPALQGDYVVVGDFEGYLHWFEAQNGQLVARQQLNDSRIISTPLIDDSLLYAYAIDGTMSAYSYQDALSVPKTSITDDDGSELQQQSSEQPQSDIADSDEQEDEEGLSLDDFFSIFSSDGDDDDESFDTN